MHPRFSSGVEMNSVVGAEDNDDDSVPAVTTTEMRAAYETQSDTLE